MITAGGDEGGGRDLLAECEPYGEEITVICVGPVGGPEMTLPQGSSEQGEETDEFSPETEYKSHSFKNGQTGN